MSNKRRFLLSDSMVTVWLILIFSVAVTIREPAFFGPATLINLLRGGIVTACFVLSELPVMVGGGIDVSFPAIACAAMYVPMYLFNHGMIPDSGLLFVGLALLCGLLFGLLNGFLVAVMKIPSLIATLAVNAIASGGLAFLFGVKSFTEMPEGLSRLYKMNLFVYTDPATGLSYPLTVLILVPAVLAVLLSLALKYTAAGRGLYALGGNPEAARIVGFPVKKLKLLTYAVSGLMAAVAALLYVILMQNASTTELLGSEMLVIAACIVGGCSLTGGYGSVGGALLGAVLITLIQNNLNMLGIDTKWQTFAVGVVLLFGVLITAVRGKLRWKRRAEG